MSAGSVRGVMKTDQGAFYTVRNPWSGEIPAGAQELGSATAPDSSGTLCWVYWLVPGGLEKLRKRGFVVELLCEAEAARGPTLPPLTVMVVGDGQGELEGEATVTLTGPREAVARWAQALYSQVAGTVVERGS